MAIFLTTFFLIFASICAKNIRCGVCAVIFLMPLYLLRFSIFGIPTTVLEIMIYILFLVWILSKIKNSPLNKGGLRGISSFIRRFTIKQYCLLNIGIVLLFLGLALSTLHSSDLRTSLGICKGWFFDPLLFFIVFISVIKEKKHLLLSLASWVFSGVAVSLISIFYLLNNNLSFDGRLSAFYISPNYLAMYLSPAFLILLIFVSQGLRVWSVKWSEAEFDLKKYLIFPLGRTLLSLRSTLRSVKLKHIILVLNNKKLNIEKVSSTGYLALGIVSLVIISIPLFFTYSYGAFLGIFAGVIWLFYEIPSRRSLSAEDCDEKTRYSLQSSAERLQRGENFKARLFLKILAFVILITFISITATKFNQITNLESRSSFHSRLMIWNASVEIIKDSPVFGIGPGTFQETYLAYSEKFDEPYLEWAVPQPHNTFLAFYLQTGLIGFVGFILILIWFFYRRRDEAMPRLYGQIISVLIIYILAHGLIDTMYWKNDLSLMFWLIVGLAWCCDDPVS